MLTKDQILGIKDLQIEQVEVPEWGGYVFVRGMTGAERDSFEASVVDIRGSSQKINMLNVRAKLVSLTVCDENGERIFEDADVIELGKKSALALQRLFDIAQRLSGLSKEEVNALEKN